MRMAPISGVATSNWAERSVVDHLNVEGWGVLKNGWPDFLVQDNQGRVRFIEVKPNCHNGLSQRQEKVAAILLGLGLVVELYAGRCPVWITPDGGARSRWGIIRTFLSVAFVFRNVPHEGIPHPPRGPNRWRRWHEQRSPRGQHPVRPRLRANPAWA